ncbi:MAG: hypothetical protein IT293_09780 [Deltaproteobacteria bacterium]|nr:hypothetical protein [Deltaproteobacteria bacterium]
MRLNKDHRGWLVFTIVATVVGAVSYRMYVAASPYGASGGSWPGLAYGMLGTLAMLLAGLLAGRKKVRTRRIGPARAWMQMHIWLGILAVPLILFHAGFRLGGALTTTLMALFAVVTLSGLFGLALQQYLPAIMTERVPLETLVGQMDHVRDGLATDAYELVASIAGIVPEAAAEQARLAAEQAALQARPGNWKAVTRKTPATDPVPEAALLKDVYLREIRPYLLRDARTRTNPPDILTLAVRTPEEWAPKLERLAAICEESYQLAVQRRLHDALHGWLFVHAPLSFALFVLAAFHIVMALKY